MPKLTKRLVDATAPAPSDRFVWDAELAGFGLRVYPSGAKIFLFQWKRLGRTRRLVLGRHGVVTCEQARAAARAAAGEVSRGRDPAALRDQARADLSIAELADLWLCQGCRHKKASTLASDRSRLRAHVLPLLGRQRLLGLTRTDLERFLTHVTEGRTALNVRGPARHGRRRVRGGPGGALRALGMLAAILEFARARGLRPDNPARGIRTAPAPERARILALAETARLGEALQALESEGLAWQAVAGIRLLLLTGCRRQEIMRLRWRQVDLAGRRLELPDSKTGRSTRPLAAPALAVLAGLRRRAGEGAVAADAWVLPAIRGDGSYTAIHRAWVKVRARAGLADVRLHDLRHNLASTAVAAGDSLYIVGKVLGHRKTRGAERYRRCNSRADALRRLQSWKLER